MEKRVERLNNIAKLMKARNGTTVRELSGYLGVSHMTVRRDLEALEEQGIVRIFHGGAVYNRNAEADGEYSLADAGTHNVEKKRLIGRRAAAMVEPGDVLIIDTGTTTERLAQALPLSMPVTILCYSLNILTQVAKLKNVELAFAGGSFHENTLMFESPEGIEIIKRMRATKAFISAAGVSLELGVTCLNTYESNTKIAALGSSLEKILLVDSSKFGRLQPAYFADVKDFDTVVTDASAPEDIVDAIRDLGVNVIVAGRGKEHDS